MVGFEATRSYPLHRYEISYNYRYKHVTFTYVPCRSRLKSCQFLYDWLLVVTITCYFDTVGKKSKTHHKSTS